MDARTRLLLEAPPGRTILRLAWPNVLVMAAQAAVGLIETYFVAKLGADALAGMSLVFPVLMLLQMVSAGAVGGAVLSAVARALGADDRRRVNQVVWTSVLLTLGLSGATTVGVILGGPWLYAVMGGTGGGLAAALTYSGIVFVGAVPLWLFNTFAAMIRGTGNMLVPALVIVGGALVLIPLSPMLIFGVGPFPQLGVAGGAVAVLGYYVAGAVILGWYIWSGQGVLKPSALPPSLSVGPALDILRIGAASTVNAFSTNVTVAATLSLVSAVNPALVAGYGAGVRLEYLLVPLVFGIGAPAAAMAGASMGAGNRRRAGQVAWIAAGMAALITEAIGLGAALAPEPWIRLFSTEPDIVAGGAAYLRAVGPAYGFFGAGFALYFASQGAGRIGIPLIAAILRVAVTVGLGRLAMQAFGTGGLYLALASGLALYAATNAVAVRLWSRRAPRAARSPVPEASKS